MAEGTRLRSIEDYMRRAEAQAGEFQEFMISTRESLKETHQFMEDSRKQHDGHRQALLEQVAKTDSQFVRISDMFKILMDKRRSPETSEDSQDLDERTQPTARRGPSPMRKEPLTASAYNRDFMKTTQRFMDDSNKKHEEDTGMIAEPGIKTDRQFAEITSMFHSLMQKEHSSRSGHHPDLGRSIPPERPTTPCEVVSPCPKKTISKPCEGNFITPELEFVDWNSCAVEDSLGLGNLVRSPLTVVDDGVLETQNKFLVMNNQWVHAQELFEKRPAQKLTTFGGCVELFDSVEHSFGSVDGSASFVFDPGTNRVLSWYYQRLEGLHILIFDPGGSETASLVCAKWGCELVSCGCN